DPAERTGYFIGRACRALPVRGKGLSPAYEPAHNPTTLLSARTRTPGIAKGAIMPTRSLPLRPDLDQLKRQARELQRDHAAGKPAAAARIAANHPRQKGRPLQAILDQSLTLAGAQLVIAREY